MYPRIFPVIAIAALTQISCASISSDGNAPTSDIFSRSQMIELPQNVNRTAGVSLADFDGDQTLDIALVNGRHWAFQDQILLNDGTANGFDFKPAGTLAATGYGGCAGDIDLDGDVDLLVPRDGETPVVYLNDGGGDLSETVSFAPPSNARDCALGDFNQDGEWDAVIGQRGQQTYIAFGPLVGAPEISTVFTGPVVGVTAADLNADGRPDLILSLRGEATLAVLIASGDGVFDAPLYLGEAEAQSRSAAAADWDGDGDMDIVAAVMTGPNLVFFNDDGSFNEFLALGPAGETSAAVALADINGDGRTDAVFGNERRNSLVLNLAPAPQRYLIEGPSSDTYDVALGDVTGDGLLDAVFANSNAPNRLFANGSKGTAE